MLAGPRVSNSCRWQPGASALGLLQILLGFGFVGVGATIASSARVFRHPVLLGLAVWAIGVIVLALGIRSRVRARMR